LGIFLDEFDQVVENFSEGLQWKLIADLGSRIRALRKANISSFFATHQWAFVDWRIANRIEYYGFLRGCSCNKNYSMVREQSLISDLPIGTILLEEKKVSFGIFRFPRILESHPAVQITV
jgi:hypothetical protein